MTQFISENSLHSILKDKRAFILDWDGTLYDSMQAKKDSFAKVIQDYFAGMGSAISSGNIKDIYTMHSGKPRNEILIKFAQMQNIVLFEEELLKLDNLLFNENRNALEKCNLFLDAERFLNLGVLSNYKLYISSSVPQTELNYFVKKVLPENIVSKISLILGSSTGLNKGPGHINHICEISQLNPKDLIVFGDDKADYELSQVAGVKCLLIDRNGTQLDDSLLPRIGSLDIICKLLTINDSMPL